MKHLRVAETALVLGVQSTDLLLVWRKVIRPVRAALAVFTRVKVVDERLAKQRQQILGIGSQKTAGKLRLQKIQKDLAARHAGMIAAKQTVTVIVISQPLE